jgi:hypothetical protein
VDVPGPDIGTGVREMTIIKDQYQFLYGNRDINYSGVTTGKEIHHHGIRGREEATGLGAYRVLTVARPGSKGHADFVSPNFYREVHRTLPHHILMACFPQVTAPCSSMVRQLGDLKLFKNSHTDSENDLNCFDPIAEE